MTEFKKGDKVRRTHADTIAWRGMPAGTEAEVLGFDISGMVLNGWGDGHEPSYFELVSAPDEIKAGDTVTVERSDWTAFGNERKGYTLTGEVYGDDGELWVGPISLGVHDVTVIDHQPAPEPEWKPGTVAIVSYPMYMGDGDTLDARAVLGSNGWHPFEDPTDVITPDEVTDVRPLVVIDPADVDLQALGVVYKSNSVNGRWDSRALIAVLDALGIKVEDDSL